MLAEAQRASALQQIETRTNHEKLFKAKEKELVSIMDSFTWLMKRNDQARSGAIYCFKQDRNIFCGQKGKCSNCDSHRKTVEHLATKCD